MLDYLKTEIKFILLAILIGLVLLFIIILISFLLSSRGEIESFKDASGNVIKSSIAQRHFTTINGTKHGMILRGKNRELPILLFIHGGPGVPEYFLNETYETKLEEHFLVCWLDSRGSGLSYNPEIEAKEITLNALVDDTIAISSYLCQKFQKDKIYLMGHSFGSLVGILAASKRADLYHAYIGMAQLSGGELSGVKANTYTYSYMKNKFETENNKRSLRILEKCTDQVANDQYKFNPQHLAELDNLKHEAGCGTMHHMKSVISGIFLPQIFSKAYYPLEKINYWKANRQMRETTLFNELESVDLFEDKPVLNIPVYFFPVNMTTLALIHL